MRTSRNWSSLKALPSTNSNPVITKVLCHFRKNIALQYISNTEAIYLSPSLVFAFSLVCLYNLGSVYCTLVLRMGTNEHVLLYEI
jgi:hypothetical protein